MTSDFLASVVPARAQVVRERDGWSVVIPDPPIAIDAATYDDAISEMIAALREYARGWRDHLLNAHSRYDAWSLVQLVNLSDDDQLRAWLAGTPN